MDIYGIHAAQLQGNSHAEYVKQYNSKVAAHNTAAYEKYKSAKDTATGIDEMINAKLGVEGAEHIGSGIHSVFQGVQGIKQYGSLGKYASAGTSHNMFELTGGRYGSLPMGPNETLARRGEAMADTGATAALKSAGESIAAVGTKAKGVVSSAMSAGKFTPRPLAGPLDEAFIRGKTEQLTERTARGVEASDSIEGVEGKGLMGESISGQHYLGDSAASRRFPDPQVSIGDASGKAVQEAQEKDKALGWGKEATPLSDAMKSESELSEVKSLSSAAAKKASGEHMGLMGKVVKGMGEKVLGEGSDVAHYAGVAAGPLGDIAAGVMDTEDMAKHWKTLNTADKVGDVSGDISSALGVASAAIPVLAPFAAVVGAVSAIADLIGGVEGEKKKASDSLATLQQDTQKKMKDTTATATSTATMTQPTSLQKMGGGSAY